MENFLTRFSDLFFFLSFFFLLLPPLDPPPLRGGDKAESGGKGSAGPERHPLALKRPLAAAPNARAAAGAVRSPCWGAVVAQIAWVGFARAFASTQPNAETFFRIRPYLAENTILPSDL